MIRRDADRTSGRVAAAIVCAFAAIWIQCSVQALADEFITFHPTQTNCPKCQPLVERFNASLGAIDKAIAEYRDLERKRRLTEKAIRQKKAQIPRLDREFDEVLRENRRLIDARDLDNRQIARNRGRLDEIDQEIKDLEAEIAELEDGLKTQDAAIQAQKAKVQTAQGLANNLYRDIANCEAACSPDELKPQEEAAPVPPPVTGNVGLAGGVVAPAATKCPACKPIADEINRIIGVLGTAREQRSKTAADLQSAEDRLRKAEAAERDLRKQFEETLFKQIEARKAGGDIAALGRKLTDLAFRISDVSEAQLTLFQQTEALQAEARRLDQSIASMVAQIAALRAALADCEKTCRPAAAPRPPLIDPGQNGGGAAVPDPDGFVSTDCPPCAQLASLINDIVGSLKTLRKTLAAVRGRLDAIPGEQDALEARAKAALDAYGAKVLEIAAARKAGKDLTALNDESARLSDAYTTIQDMIFELFLEKDELDEKAKDLTRQIADLEAQLPQKRDELKECEKQCQPPAGEQPPLVDPGQPGGGVALPDPDGFVSTDCPPCAQLASLINDIIGTLKTLKADLASAEAELGTMSGQQDALEKQSKAALDAYGAKVLEIAAARKAGKDLTALNRESAALSEAYTDLQDRIADLFIKEDELKAKVEDLRKQIADLEAQLPQKRDELKECEKQCQPPAGEQPPLVDPGQPGGGVALPDPDGFVSTDCPPCAQLASLINDIVGTLRTLKRNLAEAQAALDAIPDQKDALEKEAKKALDAYGDKILEIAAARKAGKDLTALNRESDALSEAYTDLQDKIFDLFVKEDELSETVKALTQQIADLEALLPMKRDELKECEKQCQPPANVPPMADPGQQGGVALPDPDGFVSTDCPPCAQLASLINDIVGSLRTLKKDLAEAQAELDTIPAQIDALEAQERAELDAYGQDVIERVKMNNAGGDTTALDAALLERSFTIGDIKDKILELVFRKDELDAKVKDLAKQIADLEVLLPKKRDELKECEKQCQPPANAPPMGDPGQQGGVTVPEGDGSVTTDCGPCAQLASLINDMIGSLRTARTELATAQAELAAVALTSEQKSAEEDRLSKEFESAILRRREIQAGGGDIKALDKMITDLAFQIGDIRDEISTLFVRHDDLEAKIKELAKQIDDLETALPVKRAELETCEERCQEKTERPVTEQGGHEPQTATAPPNLSVAKGQPEQCRLNRACAFELGVANRGEAAFAGPVFLMDRMKIPVRVGNIEQGDWFCSGGGSGTIICHANLDGLAPRAEAGVRLGIGLVGNMPRSSRENCGTLIQPVRDAQGDEARDTVRLVQLGLNRRGIDAGPADGLPGQKTTAAIASFLSQTGRDGEAADVSMDKVAEMLFGEKVFDTIIQASENAETCIPIDIKEPPRTPVRRPPPERDVPEESSPRIPFEFGIGIGTGIGGGFDQERDRGRRIRNIDRD